MVRFIGVLQTSVGLLDILTLFMALWLLELLVLWYSCYNTFLCKFSHLTTSKERALVEIFNIHIGTFFFSLKGHLYIPMLGVCGLLLKNIKLQSFTLLQLQLGC